jgi:hypothetical protein
VRWFVASTLSPFRMSSAASCACTSENVMAKSGFNSMI